MFLMKDYKDKFVCFNFSFCQTNFVFPCHDSELADVKEYVIDYYNMNYIEFAIMEY